MPTAMFSETLVILNIRLGSHPKAEGYIELQQRKSN
jgi:hypothetical protein